MIRSWLIVASIFLSFILVNAQPSGEEDSLKVLLKDKLLSEESRLKILTQLTKRYLQNEPQQAVLYADSALVIALRKKAFEKQLPELYLLRGRANRNQGIHIKALKDYDQGLPIAIRLNDKVGEAKFYGELAIVAETTGDLVKGLELNQKALTIYIEQKDTSGIVTIYNDIGVIYNAKKERDQALLYYKKAVALNKARGNQLSNARLLNNIGLVFKEQNREDSALVYFNEALKLVDVNKHKYGYALINNNLGISYREMGQYAKALDHFNTAMKLQKEMNDQYGLGLVNLNIAWVYQRQKQYKKSLYFLQQGLPYAQAADSKDVLNKIAERMAESYEMLGDYKQAYTYQKQANVYEDSLQAKSLSNEIAELEVKYQVKQQQAENDLLKAENELQLSTIKNKDLIVTTSIIFSILILTLLILVYGALRVKKKANALIKEKNDRLEILYAEVERQKKSIEEQKDEIERQNAELYMKNQYLHELNHEKNSLMGIVAHDLKSPFNSIGGITEMLPRLGPLNDGQKEFVGIISKVVEGSRSLIQDVMDLSVLENKELKIHPEQIAINTMLSNCQMKYKAQALQKSIELEVSEQADESIAVVSDKQHIDRILENLISNALKFSHPGTEVQIGARIHHSRLEFYVRDQGPGISEEDQKFLFKKFVKLSARPTSGESSSGLGLSIVKALVDELRGTIRVESQPGKGATFTCSLPLH